MAEVVLLWILGGLASFVLIVYLVLICTGKVNVCECLFLTFLQSLVPGYQNYDYLVQESPRKGTSKKKSTTKTTKTKESFSGDQFFPPNVMIHGELNAA